MKDKDLISRKALLEEYEWLMMQIPYCKQEEVQEHIDRIDRQPAVDAEPVKHGRWEHLGGDEWRCTNCGEIIHTEGSWEKPTSKYCCECGAKMDEVEETKA